MKDALETVLSCKVFVLFSGGFCDPVEQSVADAKVRKHEERNEGTHCHPQPETLLAQVVHGQRHRDEHGQQPNALRDNRRDGRESDATITFAGLALRR